MATAGPITVRAGVTGPDETGAEVARDHAVSGAAAAPAASNSRAIAENPMQRMAAMLLKFTRQSRDGSITSPAALVRSYWRKTGKWGDGCKPIGADDFQCE
jgi:hypothetical protein